MIEEPKISADDTNPSRAVRITEPPIYEGDTNPSQAIRRTEPPRSRGPRWGLRLAGMLVLLITVGALGVAGLSLLDTGGDQPDAPAATLPPTLPAHESARQDTPAPTDDPDAERTTVSIDAAPVEAALRPTAAADEIAVALMTPAPQAPASDTVVRASAPFTIRNRQQRAEVIQYTVRDGDTLESIADRFGLDDFYTIVWSNKASRYNPLSPGNSLNIMPEDGVYHELTENITIEELAEQYDVDPYTIIDSPYNDHLNLFGATPQTLLPAGAGWVVIPGGKGEQVNLLPAFTAGSGTVDSSGAISGSYTLWGCTANVSGGTYPTQRPLAAYTFMQDYHGGHQAVDLAPKSGDVGDPIQAAGSGTVVYSGWNNYGYGNVVVIAHGSTFTLYAHMLRRAVSCGDYVEAGQVIGYLGNTGNSSGPHLHFEIRDANFVPRNPRYDISF